jgi:hypothetical protein
MLRFILQKNNVIYKVPCLVENIGHNDDGIILLEEFELRFNESGRNGVEG